MRMSTCGVSELLYITLQLVNCRSVRLVALEEIKNSCMDSLSHEFKYLVMMGIINSYIFRLVRVVKKYKKTDWKNFCSFFTVSSKLNVEQN